MHPALFQNPRSKNNSLSSSLEKTFGSEQDKLFQIGGEVIIWERKSKEEKEINCSNDRAHWILSTLGPVCQVDMFQTVPDTSSYVKVEEEKMDPQQLKGCCTYKLTKVSAHPWLVASVLRQRSYWLVV
ncbi:hypothetical protein AMECASPLE_002958 [Ameca splendens]|uniref:Uncharacterized protein n=1 Tax=Ameca splendens TaxID=208324 RepID=A0ABV0ZI64_9TELE